jgi:transposase-like protein
MEGQMSKTFSDEQIDEIAKRYLAGASVAQLALAFGVSPAPIRNALKMAGVVMRPVGAVPQNVRASWVIS